MCVCVCVRVRVRAHTHTCFNSSEATGRMNLKLITINHHSGMSVISHHDDVTIKNIFLKSHFFFKESGS